MLSDNDWVNSSTPSPTAPERYFVTDCTNVPSDPLTAILLVTLFAIAPAAVFPTIPGNKAPPTWSNIDSTAPEIIPCMSAALLAMSLSTPFLRSS